MAELARARTFWLRSIQHELFHSDIAAIRNDGMTSDRSLKHFLPFLDGDELLRIGGRLAKAALTHEEAHPILLKTHYLVKLLIKEKHVQLLHCGTSVLLAALRKEFWILRPRPLIRSIIYNCTICTRYRARPAQQLMSALPRVRVTQSIRPFLHTGVDYAGPIAIRASSGRGSKSLKAYLAIFVCLVTKAIHIEAASDYTTASFHAVLHRFVSRRGIPSDLYSDNGTNFIGEQRELATNIRRITHSENFKGHYSEKGITWHFIPPAAPHFGGLWEVAVRSVKRYLVKAIGNTTLTFEELSTMLNRIEACINSRPLYPLSDNADDYSVLTPAHFLIGDILVSLPEPSVLELKETRLSRWQLVQRLTEQFWESWRHDYLHTLQQRSKWLKADTSIAQGRMVLLVIPGVPPSRWPLGRIVECHPGDDGLVRVTVKTSTSTLKRPVTKLCFLSGDINRAMESSPTPPTDQ